jgi:hypothetical protein
MKKTLLLTAALLAGGGLADDPVESFTAASEEMTLDTRTQGADVLAEDAVLDARGLTFDVSNDIWLNTKKIIGTMILLW